MSHITFTIVTYKETNSNKFLFLKGDTTEIDFFTWKSNAINGRHESVSFKKKFLEFFNVDNSDIEEPQEIPLDLSDKNSETSVALFKVEVSKHFYDSTKMFLWFDSEQLEKHYKGKAKLDYQFKQEWILPYLFKDTFENLENHTPQYFLYTNSSSIVHL